MKKFYSVMLFLKKQAKGAIKIQVVNFIIKSIDEGKALESAFIEAAKDEENKGFHVSSHSTIEIDRLTKIQELINNYEETRNQTELMLNDEHDANPENEVHQTRLEAMEATLDSVIEDLKKALE